MGILKGITYTFGIGFPLRYYDPLPVIRLLQQAGMVLKDVVLYSDLTEEEENAVIFREIKQAQETIDTTPADRVQTIEEARLRMQVYGEFAPKLMDEDEIRAVIKEVLAELQIEQPTAKDKGRIMKTLMPRVKGKADGGLVNQVLGGFFA